MKKALRGVAIWIPVLLILMVSVILCLSSLQGAELLWTPIDGEITSLDLGERTHVCHVEVRARGGTFERYSFDGELCNEAVGAGLHKASWAITVRSSSGRSYRQLTPVLAGSAGALWSAGLGGLLFYSAFIAPFRDRRRDVGSSPLSAAPSSVVLTSNTLGSAPYVLGAWSVGWAATVFRMRRRRRAMM